jgi:hypothetical protein
MRARGEEPLTDRAAAVALTGSTIGGNVIVHVTTETRRAVERWRARRAPSTLDRQYEDRVAGRFVTPPGWDRATSTLQQQRMVLLQAAAGSGRRTAAVHLLRTDDGGNGPIHELPVPAEENPDEHVLDPDDIAENDRLLLDLSPISDERVETLHSRLGEFWDTVCERHAVLVVVFSERNARVLDPELVDLLVRLGRPNGEAVFRRHLDAYKIDNADHELYRDELVSGLFDLRRAPLGSSLTIGGCAGCSATVLGAGSSPGCGTRRRRVSPA